jgi:pyridoxal phosphate enzyme (YggS family)
LPAGLVNESFATCLSRVRQRIEAAAQRAGRDTDEVVLVAVTKTVAIERIYEAVEAGQSVFGENRVQEAAGKVAALQEQHPEVHWHLIGHLQTNKAKAAADLFSLIESVDSQKLAARLDGYAAGLGKPLSVLLEVNVAGEPSKSGFSPEALGSCISDLLALPNLELRGLMMIAPPVSDPEEVRWVFRSLRRLRDHLRDRFDTPGFTELSMGMTDDFEVAVEEGATMVRIGRALFGERPPPRRHRL